MEGFIHTGLPGRVVYGPGAVGSLGDEIGRLGAGRALICSTPGRRDAAEALAARFPGRIGGVCAEARTHVPTDVVAVGRAAAQRAEADSLVAYGGGSAIGLAKMIAHTAAIPIVAVPTTFSGSESTDIEGMLEDGVKRLHQSARMLPATVIYDPELVRALPSAVAVASGFNAMAHAVEAFYSPGANPFASLLAEEGLRTMARALERLAAEPRDLDGWGLGLRAAWLCGQPIVSAGIALHHKAAHVVGGSWGLPHAETHTALLPHSIAYNAAAAPAAMDRIGRALGAAGPDAAGAMYDLMRRVEAPLALRDVGFPEAGIEEAVTMILAAPCANPRPLSAAPLRVMLTNAWRGSAPV